MRAVLRNPYLILTLALATFVLGVFHYLWIPKDLLPIYTTPAVQIVTFYPGMPPVVMERDIMSRLQRWTGQSVGIEHQEAKAMLGVCIVKDFFHEGISLETAMSQVTSYAMSDMFYLPPGTIPPMVMPFDPTASLPLCLISVSSSRPVRGPEDVKRLEKELYDVAYFELRNRLQSIRGVIAPAVYGGRLRRILAYLDREKLVAHGLSLVDVQRALLSQNVLIPAGNAKLGEADYQIFTNAIPSQVELLNDVPIKTNGREIVRLKDVGEVRDAAQIQTNIVRINGRKPAMYIPIYRQPGANTIAIVDSIRSRLERIQQRIHTLEPEKAEGLELGVIMDQSQLVRESIAGLQFAVGMGALLAAAIVWLFLRQWRLTLIVALAIPLSVLATFIGLFYTGDTINAMTLGGIALAVGILVDHAIVVLDNIARHRSLGKRAFDAAADGAREVALPLGISILTFIVVFYPVVFLSGLARYLFTPLAVAVTFAVLAAYLIALFFVPTASYVLWGKGQGTAGDPSDDWLSPVIRGYAWLLERTLRHKVAVIAVTLVLVGGSVWLLFQTGAELFPPIDSGQFTLFVRLPAGTRIERTEELVAEVERTIIEHIGQPDPGYARGQERYPESNLQLLISNIGVLMDWPAAYTPNTGPMDAFLLVQLKRKAGMPGVFDYVARLRHALHRRFPGVEFAFDTGGLLTAAMNLGEPSPIHLQVTGSRLEDLYAIGRRVRDIVRTVPGAVDVRIYQRLDNPTLEVEIDRLAAASVGVTTEDVMKNLVSATNSSINFEPAFWIDERNGNHYFLGVQYREEDIIDLDTLLDIPIRGQHSEKTVPLRSVARIRRSVGPAVVTHRNITRTVDVYANVLPAYDVGSVVAAIERALEADETLGLTLRRTERGRYYEVGGRWKNKGYSLEYIGEVRTMRQAFRQFSLGLLLAGILIYLVMVSAFRSFFTPAVVMATVPMGLIGVAVVLWLTGTRLNVSSFMGVIMMMGIVVEYSIVLLDFAERRVREGATYREAVFDAALVRFRPILMTSLTTLMALVPLAVGFAGSEAEVPMARAIVGGVLAATLLPKFVVPSLYALGDLWHRTPSTQKA